MLDVPAAITKIKATTGVDKVAYIGASQGSTIMFYALTKETEEDFFADNMSTFIALAPCMVAPAAPYSYERFIDTEWKGLETYPNLIGGNWTADGYCDATRSSDGSDGMFCFFLRAFSLASPPSTDTRSMFQLSQTALEQRFQAWSEDYDTPEGRQTELADITKIDKVPVYLINGENDINCETDARVTEIGQEIPSFQKKTTIPNIAHNDFLAPTGSGGNLILATIIESLDEVKEMEA